MSFQAFKRNRTEQLGKLQEKLQNEAKGGFSNSEDANFWQPTVDKDGNGYAKIRFLPNPNVDSAEHWVKIFQHAFKDEGTNRWYIENCLTTIGKEDPVVEANNKLWELNTEESKAQARNQKRKVSYISNILVEDDPAKPENNGRVFKFKYGKKIFEKLNDLMNPQFPGDKAINPFDPYDGASLRLRIHKAEGGYRSYDKSQFESPSELLGGDDDKLQAIWDKLFKIEEEIAPEKFKSYDELSAKYLRVIGKAGGSSRQDSTQKRAEDVADDDSLIEDEPVRKTAETRPKPAAEPEVRKQAAAASIEDDDDDLAAFQKLAQEWSDD